MLALINVLLIITSSSSALSEHHSQTVDLLDESIALLRDSRTQALSEDGSGLEMLASKGMGIEAKARRVDARAGELRRTFGIDR